MRIPDLIAALRGPSGLASSNSEKAEALPDNLESQFESVPLSPITRDKCERVREDVESSVLASTVRQSLSQGSQGARSYWHAE